MRPPPSSQLALLQTPAFARGPARVPRSRSVRAIERPSLSLPFAALAEPSPRAGRCEEVETSGQGRADESDPDIPSGARSARPARHRRASGTSGGLEPPTFAPEPEGSAPSDAVDLGASDLPVDEPDGVDEPVPEARMYLFARKLSAAERSELLRQFAEALGAPPPRGRALELVRGRQRLHLELEAKAVKAELSGQVERRRWLSTLSAVAAARGLVEVE